jgi:hypothetical protein
MVVAIGEHGDDSRKGKPDQRIENDRQTAVSVFVAAPRKVGEEAGQREREGEAVTEPRRAAGRPCPTERQHPDRPDEIPGAVQRLAPAVGAAEPLGAGREAVPQHADGPHQLVGTASCPPLVEQHQGEDEAEHR